MNLPDPIRNAAAAFDSLPGVGPRAALRYAYWLVTQPKEIIQQFAKHLDALAVNVTNCQICFQWAEQSPCIICRDPSRDQKTLCVVALSPDIRMIEETGVFKGRYHVLGGTIDPIEGRTPETLKIRELLSRIIHSSTSLASDVPGASTITELILALDTDLKGDTTTLFLRKQLAGLPIRLTKLARGLPTGAALEYADAHTLADAFLNRKETRE